MGKYTEAELADKATEFLIAYNNMDPRSLVAMVMLSQMTGLSNKEVLARIEKLKEGKG